MSLGVRWLMGIFVAGVHWFVMGMFLVGESPHLSPRVQAHVAADFRGPRAS